MKSACILAVLSGVAMAAPVSAARLEVRIEGLRNNAGEVRIALHSPETDFPDGWSTAVAVKAVPPTGARESVVFENVSPGPYALIAIHDEDGDGRMTKTWLGLPLEGFGTSNNPTFYGPPRYRAARIDVTGDATLVIRMVYF